MVWACLLALPLVGTMRGQAAPDDYTPSSDLQTVAPQYPDSYTAWPPVPTTVPATEQGQGGGISSQRTQNRAQNPVQNQTQAGSVPSSMAPSPLTEFQRVVEVSTGRMLPIFGAAMFSAPPSTFAPVDNNPVTPDYVIGPGDELRLQMWWSANRTGSFVVDRTGSIALPEVGTVHVAGLQFSQLRDFIKPQLERAYRNIDLNVNMGQLRSIQVFVVGQARKPGSFTLSSLSTLLNALFASGGPLPQGSLRDIQVKRGGETITHFDLYDLLLHGDKSKDVRLEPGDVIFIPDVGPQVAMLGSVTNPAIYEMRGETSFNQAVALAGGLTNAASDSRLRVERIYKHTERNVIEIGLADDATAVVQDGDIVNVSSIIDRFKDAVTLRGNVANPGRYVWHQGMRISDLIPDRDALITRNYYLRQDQLGQARTAYAGSLPTTGTNGLSTSSDLNGPQPNQILSNSQLNPNSSGGTTGTNDGTTPTDYGATRPEGSLGLQTGAVGDAAAGRQGPTSGAIGNSSVGAALTAGNSNFSASTDVVLSAPDIDWNYAVVERQSATDLTTSLLPFNLRKAVIDKDPAQDIELLSGDVVTVFSQADIRMPTSQQTKFVKLEGEFVGAGMYSVLPGETLRHLVARAGGLTPNADLFASEFTRESVRRAQRQRLLEYADQLETQIAATTSAETSAAVTDRDAAAATASAANSRAMVTRLRAAQPSGRIVLKLKPDSKGIDSLPDIELQDGDRFVVPREPATVSVAGQVYNANAFIYMPGKRVKDYLHLAGGPDRIGDRKREFVLRADGSVVSRQYNSSVQRTLFSDRGFDDAVLYPGDTIVVPPAMQNGAILRNLSNIATVIGGFGMGIAALAFFL